MARNTISQGLLPPPVQQAAAYGQLGGFQKAYQASLVRTVMAAIIFTCAAVGSLAGFAFGNDLNGTTRIVLLLFALLFLGLVLSMIYDTIQAAYQQLYLFQQGTVITKGKQVQVFPWRDTAVWQSITRRYRNGVHVGTNYIYTLRRMDGYQIKLNNLTKNIAELGQAVVTGITREQVPPALAAIRAGQTLTFARFSLNQQGINNGREWLAWTQVQAVEMNRGYLIVKKVGKSSPWEVVLVAKIPNIFILMTVAEEMRRQTGNGLLR